MANGVVRVGNGFFDLSQVKKWLKAGRIRRVPGKLEWVFSELPPDKRSQALIENLAVRIGNNLAYEINKRMAEIVEFTHDPHPMTTGEKKFRDEQRLGILYTICVTKALEEFNNPGTPFKEILAEMDAQE